MCIYMILQVSLLDHVKEMEKENENDVYVSIDTTNNISSPNDTISTLETKLSTIGFKLSELEFELSKFDSDVGESLDTSGSNMIGQMKSLLEATRQCLSRKDRQQKDFLQSFPDTLTDMSTERGGYACLCFIYV